MSLLRCLHFRRFATSFQQHLSVTFLAIFLFRRVLQGPFSSFSLVYLSLSQFLVSIRLPRSVCRTRVQGAYTRSALTRPDLRNFALYPGTCYPSVLPDSSSRPSRLPAHSFVFPYLTVPSWSARPRRFSALPPSQRRSRSYPICRSQIFLVYYSTNISSLPRFFWSQ